MEVLVRGKIIDESFTESIPQPGHIDVNDHFWDAFDNMETEISARYLVRLAQQEGSWRPFTREEVEKLYQDEGHQHFSFNRLIHPQFVRDLTREHWEGGGWIVEQDDRLFFTTDFIERVFKSSPKQ